MKKYIYIFAFLGLSLCNQSCMNKLEILPNDQIITDNFFEKGTAEEIESGVNSMYQRLQSSYMYNLRMWTLDIVAGEGSVGNEAGGNGLETTQLANFITTSDNSGAKELWRGPWAGISRTNWILNNIDDAARVSPEKIVQYKGEAHFLRALYYFNLVRLFGDVPLIKTQQTAGDDLQVSRSPKEEVYELIIQDLKDAASMLPAQYELSSDIGRATKGASLGLLAKVYLTLKKYDDVISTIEELDALNIYTLNRKYDWNFDYLRENGPESLFEVQYEKDVTTYSEFDILGQGGWHNDYMAPLAPIAIGGRWGNFGWFAVYPEFVNSYEAGDLRKSVSVWCQGDQYKGWAYDPSVSQTGHNVKKFLCEDIGQDRAMDSPLNFPILRYADVLLMLAEAYNENNQLDKAVAEFNKVRARVDMPGLNSGPAWMLVTSKEQMAERIRKERAVEFAGEGLRFSDLRRWGWEIASKAMSEVDAINIYGEFLYTHKFSERDMLWPIPGVEIERNEALKQNPGW